MLHHTRAHTIQLCITIMLMIITSQLRLNVRRALARPVPHPRPGQSDDVAAPAVRHNRQSRRSDRPSGPAVRVRRRRDSQCVQARGGSAAPVSESHIAQQHANVGHIIDYETIDPHPQTPPETPDRRCRHCTTTRRNCGPTSLATLPVLLECKYMQTHIICK